MNIRTSDGWKRCQAFFCTGDAGKQLTGGEGNGIIKTAGIAAGEDGKPVDTLMEAVAAAFPDGIRKGVLSSPATRQVPYRKIVISARKDGYQAEKFTATQVFHENWDYETARRFIAAALGSEYKQYNGWSETEEFSLRVSKKGKLFASRKQTEVPVAVRREHNRRKRYLLEEGKPIPPLVDMGIFTAEGRIVQSMHDKYRQINRFIEIVDDELDRFDQAETLNVLDFGCGKSYLTFILYYYLTEIRCRRVRMIGLDLKRDVIEKCNATAEKYRYHDLHFQVGDIGAYDFDGHPHMVISLHACDTATDYALFNAVRWKADAIFSVPCCQHELNGQMMSESFAALTRYGIVKERIASLMTDAVRANLLQSCGYKTQLLEFISLDHTPKNLLIRAVRGGGSPDGQPLREVRSLMEEFHVQPTLYRLLEEEGLLDRG